MMFTRKFRTYHALLLITLLSVFGHALKINASQITHQVWDYSQTGLMEAQIISDTGRYVSDGFNVAAFGQTSVHSLDSAAYPISFQGGIHGFDEGSDRVFYNSEIRKTIGNQTGWTLVGASIQLHADGNPMPGTERLFDMNKHYWRKEGSNQYRDTYAGNGMQMNFDALLISSYSRSEARAKADEPGMNHYAGYAFNPVTQDLQTTFSFDLDGKSYPSSLQNEQLSGDGRTLIANITGDTVLVHRTTTTFIQATEPGDLHISAITPNGNTALLWQESDQGRQFMTWQRDIGLSSPFLINTSASDYVPYRLLKNGRYALIKTKSNNIAAWDILENSEMTQNELFDRLYGNLADQFADTGLLNTNYKFFDLSEDENTLIFHDKDNQCIGIINVPEPGACWLITAGSLVLMRRK